MRDQSMENLITALEAAYPAAVTRYGSSPDETHGIGFRIKGVPATFSVLTLDGMLPPNTYDIQIESFPPDIEGYIYTAQVSLHDLMLLIQRYLDDPELWPVR